MTAFETFALANGLPFLAGLATWGLGKLCVWAIAKLQSDPKTAPLAEGVVAGEDAVSAAIAALVKNAASPAAMPKAALDAALAALKADAPALAQAGEAELLALFGPKDPTATTAGGASVNLPSLNK